MVSTKASEGVIFCTPATTLRPSVVVWLMGVSGKGGWVESPADSESTAAKRQQISEIETYWSE
jgi:hypothetical protein